MWLFAETSLYRRLAVLLAAQVVLFLWARFVVAPATKGWPRAVRAAPLTGVLIFLAFLFDASRSEEFVLAFYCLFNFLWVTLSKLCAFCMNRGPLVKSRDCGSDTAFAVALLFPVLVAFETLPESSEKERSQYCIVRLRGEALREELRRRCFVLAAEVCLIAATSFSNGLFARSGHEFWRDVCLSWFTYGSTAWVQDTVGFFVVLASRLKLLPSFDKPWMAQSVKELWSWRYNRDFGTTLRDLIYEPICQGQWIQDDKAPRVSRVSLWRRSFAAMMCFATSGLLHAYFLWNILAIHFPWLYCTFFAANALIVVLETALKRLLVDIGIYDVVLSFVPSWAFVLYVNVVLMCLAHWLFWPDLLAIGFEKDMMKGVAGLDTA